MTFAVTLLAAGAAAADTQPGIDPWGSVANVGYALGLIIVLIIGGGWLMRRLGHPGNAVGGLMRVLGVLSVGARERVLLVEVGDRQLLIGVAPGRVTTLHVLERSLEVKAGVDTGAGFRSLLANLAPRQGDAS